MGLFDAYIDLISGLIGGKTVEYRYNGEKVLPVEQRSGLVLMRDTAFEFGGSDLPSGAAYTLSSEDFLSGTIVAGKDIFELTSDSPYIKLVILRHINENLEGQELFDAVKNLECIKYGINIPGFMVRASTLSRREQVRVSKEGVKNGLTLEKIGNTIIKSYLETGKISAAKVIFITEADVDYAEILKNINKLNEITNALNKVYDDVLTDCDSCSLKGICDEVEILREMHFGMAGKKRNG